MNNGTAPSRDVLDDKVNRLFAGKVVRKDLRFFADRAAKKWPLRGSLKSPARCLYRVVS